MSEETAKKTVGRTVDLTGVCRCNQCDSIRISISAACSSCGYRLRGLRMRLGWLFDILEKHGNRSFRDFCDGCGSPADFLWTTAITPKAIRAQLARQAR